MPIWINLKNIRCKNLGSGNARKIFSCFSADFGQYSDFTLSLNSSRIPL